ncbi:CBS domain-containing protein [Methanococcoides methylutens]|uniref:CBS domain protein n=1 Tax=Methanococcoides methylutens MM1 TaxID=1434104 RepID=A0A0E3ST32_METMT|nr:CBS domain-containing protein [Methanococcoides methylutens]AKB85883.1 CBS domain protein [Methanococcoides methylutens MM1]
MKVKDIMSSSVIVCSPEDPISSAAQLLKKENISGVPVVSDGDVVGIVSEGDLLKLLDVPEHGGLWLPSPFEVIEIPIRELISWEDTKRMLSDIGSKPIRDIMEKDVFSIGPESSVEDASRLMTKHKINRLPVLDDSELVGIITRGDIIRGLAGI